jgi:LysR family transcriptional regulator of gallate degradation
MLSLHHLRVLSAVAAHGSVRAAAEQLLRAPSAVSRSVTLLEQALATRLFERRGRGMLPTASADCVLARVAAIDAELDRIVEEAGCVRGQGAAVRDALYDERRLQALSLLAEVRHMPTVARQLGVTQPAISAAVARVEDALRQRLFLRTGRGLLPSDAGARWLPRLDRVLAALRHIEDDVAALQGSLAGLVTVGCLPLARTQLLPQAISALLPAHPLLRVHALESPYEQLCAGLLAGKVDFILGALRPGQDPALHSETLFVDQLGVVASAQHALARRRRLRLRDLRGHPWVLSRPGTPLRESLAQHFTAHGEPAPVATVETGDQTLVRGLLLQGQMLTVLSARQLQREIDSGDLVMLALALPGLARRIGITVRAGAQLPATALALLAALRQFAR